MARSNAYMYQQKVPVPPESLPHWFQDDPRWILAQRIATGCQFARSTLLPKFLLFVVAEALEGREARITEHQIGVRVFDRRPGYSTIEDNIVRNYARQLRKRLAEYFASEGRAEPLRIDIPCGGYVPVFVYRENEDTATGAQQLPMAVSTKIQSAQISETPPKITTGWNWKRWLLAASLLIAYSVAIIFAAWLIAGRGRASHLPADPEGPLWAALFRGPENTYIVPADAGFNLIEDMSSHPLPLADYIGGGYLDLPLTGIDAQSASDLRSQQFTSFVDFQIGVGLAKLPEYDPKRVQLRFPRDLRLDDLKNANAVLIGSVGSNPWASIAEAGSNFRIIYRQAMQGASIINTHPQPGEAPFYVSHWNEPAHETFALIAFLPNLAGTGRLLLLQGLDVAGTQAAAETMFHPAAIDPILRRATRPDGSLRFFEILLRSTSIKSNSAGTQVIASRIY